jgi:hypothetical protein
MIVNNICFNLSVDRRPINPHLFRILILTDRYCHFVVVRLWYGAWLAQSSTYARVIAKSKRAYLLRYEMHVRLYLPGVRDGEIDPMLILCRIEN